MLQRRGLSVLIRDDDRSEKATTADLKAELEAGADVMARDIYGETRCIMLLGTAHLKESISFKSWRWWLAC